MVYEFKCKEHGTFNIEQSILDEHKLKCPTCGAECKRVYSTFRWMWAGAAFRPDGSYRQDRDYDILKG